MNILLSNDDGIMSRGLAVLAGKLSEKHNVFVSAPSVQQSAVSRAMTLFSPLYAEPYPVPGIGSGKAYSVTGTPVDCVRLGLGNLFKDIKFDLVLSGINRGPNLGTDILYSGTVAAAAEAALLGYPAISVSLDGEDPVHFESAARGVEAGIDFVTKHQMPFGTLLNMNFPDLPYSEIKGWRLAPLGYQEYALPFIEKRNEAGKNEYWPPMSLTKKGGPENADCFAIRGGYVTLTPVGYDLTDYKTLARFPECIEGDNK